VGIGRRMKETQWQNPQSTHARALSRSLSLSLSLDRESQDCKREKGKQEDTRMASSIPSSRTMPS
jgi:hypothetical protein